jgi:predicted Abi (CAAX) family protease
MLSRTGDGAVPALIRRAAFDVAGENRRMVSGLLAVTFACGLVIALAHVANMSFVAPVYDVVANLLAFGCAVAASILLGHWVPALLSAVAVVCWLVLARRTFRARSSSDHAR